MQEPTAATRAARGRAAVSSGARLRQARQRGERVEERRLCRQDLPARLGEIEPLAAVDLGKRLRPPRDPRPLRREDVAAELRGIEVAAHRPGMDVFAARLPYAAERQRVAGRRAAGLLRELAPRDREQILALGRFALRNRHAPRSLRRQNGPPGWTRNTSSPRGPVRWRSSPALTARARELSA